MHRILFVIWLGVLSSSLQAKELTLGLIPEQNVFEQVATYKPLEDYIASKTGMHVKLTILSRYGNIIEHFAQRKLDGAFWGSFTGAMAIKKLGVEPIARPLWLDGSSTYRGYIFVKKSSTIRHVADMRGKTVAFVERATTAGYVFPIAYFRENGVTDIDSYFKEYYFTGSHDAAMRAVLNGEADIGAAKNTIFDLVARADPRVTKDLMVLAESPKVPSNGLGVRKTLDPDIKRQLKNVLLGMDRDTDGVGILKRFGALKFIATVKEDYNPVFEIARKAGIDVENYVYVNQ
jgi:phosphonate transport system substrate-binding protein